MKVLWLSHLIPYPPKGGVLQRAYYLLKELSKYHSVDLLAFHQRPLMAPLFSSQKIGLQEAASELGEICDYFEYVEIPADSSFLSREWLALRSLFMQAPYTINWLKSKEYEYKIKCLLEKNDYDLVHFDTISLLSYQSLVQHIPCVLDHHNIESHMLFRRAENTKNLFKKWYFSQEGRRLQEIEHDACAVFSLNITCSDMDSVRLRNISPDSIVETVPNGVDIEYYSPRNDSEITPCSLVFVGRMDWYPNLQALESIVNELWPVIREAFTNIKFDIVGANPPDFAVKLSERDDRFNVHGFVDDLRPILGASLAVVCPITDGGGTKLKVLDALAMGKAIVAHPVACEGIEVVDGENVLFAESVDEYTQKIRCLMEDSRRRRVIELNARELAVDHYSFENIGKRLSLLYESLLT